LEQLSCYNNQITSLPDNLPNALKELYCSVNNLTSLPDKLPATLEHLTCEYNQITLLPDNLPTTLLSINFNNNPLEANYPGIFAFEHYQIKKIIAYVRKCNAQRRTTQRLRIINAGNVFLELYMKRRMHPDNFKALLADPDIDVDEYMEAYVAAL
jgi:Leucine-rich repeat (LRR) protein